MTRKWGLYLNILVDMIIVIVIVGLTLASISDFSKCKTPIFLWMWVYAGISLVRTIKMIIMTLYYHRNMAVPNLC